MRYSFERGYDIDEISRIEHTWMNSVCAEDIPGELELAAMIADASYLRAFLGAPTPAPALWTGAKTGSKHHVLTDLHGTPLVVKVTRANEDDQKQLLPMIDGVPRVVGKVGAPKRKPKYLLADRGYDSDPHRQQLRVRGIEPVIGRRNTGHGSGLGKFPWPVERTISWLHQFRRLRSR